MQFYDGFDTEGGVLENHCECAENLADFLLTRTPGERVLEALDASTIQDWSTFAAGQLKQAPELAAFWKAAETCSQSEQLLSSVVVSEDALERTDSIDALTEYDSDESNTLVTSSPEDDGSVDDLQLPSGELC